MSTAQSADSRRRRSRTRNIWLTVHLWLGLSVGLLFVLSGLTGSLLVFYVEIDELLHQELRIQKPGDEVVNFERVFLSLRKAHPDRIGSWRIENPRSTAVPVVARYYKPPETAHLNFAPLMVAVDPYAGTVLSSRFWGQFLMTWLYDLHYSLLLDRSGKTVMSIVGGILLISLGSGLYLWWPSLATLRTAFCFKRTGRLERTVFDVHKLTGIYSLIVLLIIVVTGAVLEIPDYVHPVIEEISPLFKPPRVYSTVSTSDVRLPVDRAIAIARERFPDAALCWVATPEGPAGVYRVDLRQPNEPSGRFPRTQVWIDQYDGRIISVQDSRQNGGGDVFLAWLHPLHSGEAVGLPGRLAVLVSGFVPLMLYVTGFIRWRQKRRAARLQTVKRVRDQRSLQDLQKSID